MSEQRSEDLVSSLFLFLPLLYVILSFLVFTYPLHPTIQMLLPLPLYTGLVFLAVGSWDPLKRRGSKLRMLGWIVFAFCWSTQPLTLYYS